MSTRTNTRPTGWNTEPGPRRGPDVRAERRAWWSLALYPLTFVAAFVIGEGIGAALGIDPEDPALGHVVLAATPALLVFVLPGVLAVYWGIKATRLGRPNAKTPAIIGATIAIGGVGINLASFLLQVLLG